MAEETTAAEFRDEEHRDSHLRALENEYGDAKRRADADDGDPSEKSVARRARRLNEIDGELKRIRGDGYPGHQDRLAGAGKTNRTAA